MNDASEGTSLWLGNSRLQPIPAEGYVIRIPLLRTQNRIQLTVRGPNGATEDWQIQADVKLEETAVYVDETCRDNVLRIREVSRSSGPQLLFIGCRAGSRPQDLSLDVLWAEMDRVGFREGEVQAGDSILTVPLEASVSTQDSPRVSRLTGITVNGQKSVFEVSHEPYSAPPFELWTGLAALRTVYSQVGFPAEFQQVSPALLGRLWFRPHALPVSFLVQGYLTFLPISEELFPSQGYQETVKSRLLTTEIKYLLLNRAGWRVSPAVGAWLHFMTVNSRRFGIQRLLGPSFGLSVQREFGPRDSGTLGFRFVPLQPYFNPLEFSKSLSRLEFEATFEHSLWRRNRIFATASLGLLERAAVSGSNQASGKASFLLIGAGYGW